MNGEIQEMVKSVIDVYSEIAKSNPTWTAQEEAEFVRSCTTKTGKWRNNAAKDKFVNEAMKHNLNLVFKFVNKLAFNKNDDVFQKAVIGMVEALKKYDPKRKGKISTWITNPIRWAIMQHQNAYAKSGTVAEQISALNHKFQMNMSVISIDAPIGGEEDNDTIATVISNSSLDKDYIIDRNFKSEDELRLERDMVIAVEAMMKKLPKILNKKEIRVVKGVLKGKTQTDISVELHLSKVRISQLQASAFEKIRNSPMGSYLRKLLK
jgi:RNA polymerase sigma factor (sigma-70 family)